MIVPTDKQIKVIEKLIERLGTERVESYFYKRFPNGDFSKITKEQAQKLITALGHMIARPVYRVYGRDIF